MLRTLMYVTTMLSLCAQLDIKPQYFKENNKWKKADNRISTSIALLNILNFAEKVQITWMGNWHSSRLSKVRNTGTAENECTNSQRFSFHRFKIQLMTSCCMFWRHTICLQCQLESSPLFYLHVLNALSNNASQLNENFLLNVISGAHKWGTIYRVCDGICMPSIQTYDTIGRWQHVTLDDDDLDFNEVFHDFRDFDPLHDSGFLYL